MIGTILSNRYKLIAELGSGGVAWVYLAKDLTQGDQVAVKILYPQHSKDLLFVQRFNREARLSMTLSQPSPHPNIVRVLDYGADRDTHYLVMEYVPGQDLGQLIEQQGPLPSQKALRLAYQVALALKHAHERDIVHRDIKPSNIMILPDGTARVLDFGIARAQTSPHLTIAGFVGSPHYTAPEQARGQEVDVRADIYSLGIVLYRMLSGDLPFQGDTPWVVVEQHVVARPLPLHEIRPDLPEPVVELVGKAMARDSQDRFQTPDEMAQEIKALLPEQDLAVEPGPVAPAEAGVDLAATYRRAQQAIQDERWQEAVDLLSQISRSDPGFRDVSDQLEYVGAEMRLATLYRSVQRAMETELWDHAVNQLDQIAGIDPDYKDIRDLRLRAERKEPLPAGSAASNTEFPTHIPSAQDPPLQSPARASHHAKSPLSGRGRSFWILLAGGLILTLTVLVAGYLIYSAARQPSPTPVVEARQSQVPTMARTHTPAPTETIPATPTPTPLSASSTATPTATEVPPATTPAPSPSLTRPVPGTTPTTTPSPSPTPTATLFPSPIATTGPSLSGQIAFPRFDPVRGTYDIHVCTVDGADCRPITSEASQPDFLPGGYRLVIHSWNPNEKGLFLITSSGERVWYITDQVEAARPSVDFEGSLYVYHSRAESDRQPRLYRTFGADTGPIIRDASVVRGQSPSWLPDGRILYSGCWIDDCGILLTRADGTDPRQLIAGASEANPEASPTGRQVAFMSRRDGNWEIYLAPLDGGSPKRLTLDPANDGLPTWSPDGRHIAFVSDRDGEWSVWVMRPDGTGQRRLFDIGGPLDGQVRDAAIHESHGWVEERISWAPIP